ncbi:ThaI family type II restriction endonuclease [Thermodesulfovibrio sp. TK110]
MKFLDELFQDEALIKKIQNKLPHLFYIAELESSRAGKVGMEVGSIRERIITALLIYKFGENNIETEIPTTESEVDVKLFKVPISIKTITWKNLSGVKLIWTVDAEKAKEFLNNYIPKTELLLIQINWNKEGGFYYIPLEVQLEVFNKIGRQNYIKLPKPGTNPRGVEIIKEALTELINNGRTKKIIIHWNKEKIEFNPYKRWVELWRED